MKRARRVLGAVAASSLLFLGMAVVTATPAGSEPCGLVVTSSYTLQGNVAGCRDTTPITVTGNNLVLNLNGKTVSCVAGEPGEGPGIYVPSRTNVTIRNGTVRDCDTGIYLEEGGGHTLTNLNILDNIGGLHGEGIFGEGIQLYGSNDNRIVANRVIHNGTFAGIDLFDSNRNLIESNLVQDNNIIQTDSMHGGPRIMQDIGIWLIFIGDFESTSHNVVRNNQVVRNGLDGIQLGTASTENTAQGNTVFGNGFGQAPGIRNGFGIAISGQRQLVQSNLVRGNGGHGINVAFNSRNHRILNNQASGNGTAPAPIPQFDLNDLNPACDANVWQGNTGTRNQPCIR